MRWLKIHWLQVLAHLAILAPLALLIWDATHGGLSANPIRDTNLRLGKTALVLLVLSLACTPVHTILGLRFVLPLRRLLGLSAFAYAVSHVVSVIGLDYRFDFNLFWLDVGSKRYAKVGLATLVLLFPLALTSTAGWRNRLGRNWQRLHWLVYPAALLAVIHFAMQVKVDTGQARPFFIIVGILLFLRLPGIRWLAGWPRRKIEGKISRAKPAPGAGGAGAVLGPSL